MKLSVMCPRSYSAVAPLEATALGSGIQLCGRPLNLVTRFAFAQLPGLCSLRTAVYCKVRLVVPPRLAIDHV